METSVFRRLKVKSLIFWFIVSFLLINFSASYLNLNTNIHHETITFLVGIGLQFSVIIWLLYSFKKYHISVKYLFTNSKKITWGRFLMIKGLLIIMSISIMLAFQYIIALAGSASYIEELYSSADPTTKISPIYMILNTVLLAPIVEEFLFRGYLFNKWGETIGVKKAMFFTSLLFSVLHFQSGFVGQFIDGLFYCIVYMKTKNLIVPMILHIFHNALIKLITYYNNLNTNSNSIDQVSSEVGLHYLQSIGLIGIIVFTLILPVVIYIFYKLYSRSEKKSPYISNLTS